MAPATRDPEAYRLYLRGRYEWNKRGESLKESRRHFQQAVERDPGYALAWAGLADSFLMLGGWNMMLPRDAYPRAEAAANRAIEIEPTLAEPHATLGYLKTLYERDWAGAEKEFLRAVELNPEYGTAHHWYAYYHQTVGSMAQAVAEMRRAWEADPLSPVINAEMAYFLLFARRYEESVREARKAIELDPEYSWTYTVLASAYALQGKESEARAAVEKALRRAKRTGYDLAMSAGTLAFMRRREEARKLLRELEELSRKQYVFPALPAFVFAMLGENDRALDYYEKALEERSLVVSWLRDPLLDGFRSEPRFPTPFRNHGANSVKA